MAVVRAAGGSVSLDEIRYQLRRAGHPTPNGRGVEAELEALVAEGHLRRNRDRWRAVTA